MSALCLNFPLEVMDWRLQPLFVALLNVSMNLRFSCSHAIRTRTNMTLLIFYSQFRSLSSAFWFSSFIVAISERLTRIVTKL